MRGSARLWTKRENEVSRQPQAKAPAARKAHRKAITVPSPRLTPHSGLILKRREIFLLSFCRLTEMETGLSKEQERSLLLIAPAAAHSSRLPAQRPAFNQSFANSEILLPLVPRQGIFRPPSLGEGRAETIVVPRAWSRHRLAMPPHLESGSTAPCPLQIGQPSVNGLKPIEEEPLGEGEGQALELNRKKRGRK